MSTGDKILSENYFQHADHFTRILSEQANLRKDKYSEKSISSKDYKSQENIFENPKILNLTKSK